MQPALKLLVAEGGELDFDDILNGLRDLLKISDADLRETLPSGRETVFSNRLKWALTYLTTEGQIECLLPNIYTVTSLGNDVVASSGLAGEQLRPDRSEIQTNQHGFSDIAQVSLVKTPARTSSRPRVYVSFDIDPQAEDQYRQDREHKFHTGKETLIAKVHEQSPEFFENLAIDLLLAMGYARHRENLAERLGRSGDGGLDGVLQEDELGLSRIYFQAKRYKPGIAVPIAAIRDFAGSLESKSAHKGLFLTTSRFPKSALSFVASISKRIVLIDGNELARLMVRHEVGVKLRATYEVKCIDERYFTDQTSY